MKRLLLIFAVVIVFFSRPASCIAECYHLTWEEADLPASATTSFVNNQGTYATTSMGYGLLNGGRTVNVIITSYSAADSADSQWAAVRRSELQRWSGCDLTQASCWVTNMNRIDLIQDDPDAIATATYYTGGYPCASNDGGYLNLHFYGFYRGNIVSIDITSTQITQWCSNLGPSEAFAALAEAQWLAAKTLIDSKCTPAPEHTPIITLGPAESPLFDASILPPGPNLSFWISIEDPNGLADLNLATFQVFLATEEGVQERDVTTIFLQQMNQLLSQGKAHLSSTATALQLDLSLSFTELHALFGSVIDEQNPSRRLSLFIKDSAGSEGQYSAPLAMGTKPTIYIWPPTNSDRFISLDLSDSDGVNDLDFYSFRALQGTVDFSGWFLDRLMEYSQLGPVMLETLNDKTFRVNIDLPMAELCRLLFWPTSSMQFQVDDRRGFTGRLEIPYSGGCNRP